MLQIYGQKIFILCFVFLLYKHIIKVHSNILVKQSFVFSIINNKLNDGNTSQLSHFVYNKSHDFMLEL